MQVMLGAIPLLIPDLNRALDRDLGMVDKDRMEKDAKDKDMLINL